MADLDYFATLAHLQGWLGQPVALSAGQGDPTGPLDVLSVEGVLLTGYDLDLPDQEAGAVLFTLSGGEGSGLMLERSAFRGAAGNEEELTVWTGGLRVSITRIDEH